MTILTPYKDRYNYEGDLGGALYAVGDNAEFELDSQPRFMRERGLKPNHTFLDFGCGCLRGTAGLIDYLDNGNFFGVDPSPGLIKFGFERCRRLKIKNTPTLHAIDNYDLDVLLKKKFDFILSVSVFTHLMPDIVPAVFSGIRKILKDDGSYYFTMYPADGKDFEGSIELARHGKEALIKHGAAAGLIVEDIPGDYPNAAPSPNYITRVNFPNMAQWVMKARIA